MPRRVLLVLLALWLGGCAASRPAAEEGFTPYQTGVASYYAHDFHGRTTANGERYNMYALTAAHPSLPFDTVVRVTNLKNGRQVMLRVNDRGPFIAGRIIDVSYGAAHRLGMLTDGIVRVQVDLVDPAAVPRPAAW